MLVAVFDQETIVEHIHFGKHKKNHFGPATKVNENGKFGAKFLKMQKTKQTYTET
jgi:hypothetical protein